MLNLVKKLSILFRSPLCRHVTIAVFLSIIVIETVILVPSYWRQETHLLAILEEHARIVVTSTYNGGQDRIDQPLAASLAERILSHRDIKGIVLVSPEGSRLAEAGEHISAFETDESRTPAARTSSENGPRYEAYWGPGTLFSNFGVAVSLDRSAVVSELRHFVVRIAGLVLLIAAFVTLTTMLVLGHRLIFPMLQLHERLIVERDDAMALEIPPANRTDEFGDIIRKFNDMLLELYAIKGGLERHIAERTADLTESEDRYRQLAELSPEGIMVHTDGLITFANPGLAKILGAEGPAQLIGKSAIDFAAPEERERIMERRKIVDAGRVVPLEEAKYFRLDGSAIYVERAVANVIWSNKPSYLVIFRDVTERKQLKDVVHQARKMEAVGQLTGGIAHDFNNLLTIILGNAELLKERLGDDGALAENVIGAATRGAELTHRLLAFSRRQPLKPAVIDLNVLIAGMTSLIGRTLGETIRIETRAVADLWNVEADPGQVENALLNLVINARDAMPNGGSLVIETANVTLEDDRSGHVNAAPGDYSMLAVTDTGTGMPPEMLEHVFEPYFTTKDVGKGSGLGLSMVYGFSKQSGGYVTIDSEEGVYTTVRLHLPRAKGMDLSVEQEAKDGEPVACGETVLLVEDEAAVRTLTAALLSTFGYAVIEASDGDSAVAALESASRVDLLLTDVVLPSAMNGPQIAEEARCRYPGIKVLFMSGYPSKVHLHDLSNGDVEMLAKPFRKRELAQKVRSALDSAIYA